MTDIAIVELQAIAGTLPIAKSTLDDVLARVTIGPGPIGDPAAQPALKTIIGTSQLITAEAQQILALGTGVPGTTSTIEAKKDIAYLDAAARARIAEETLGIKLATYKYKNETATDRQRLGFILEDSPNVAAADMSQKQVDLYAYASMVLATVQQQQQQIAALEAEVERLKK